MAHVQFDPHSPVAPHPLRIRPRPVADLSVAGVPLEVSGRLNRNKIALPVAAAGAHRRLSATQKHRRGVHCVVGPEKPRTETPLKRRRLNTVMVIKNEWNAEVVMIILVIIIIIILRTSASGSRSPTHPDHFIKCGLMSKTILKTLD